MNKRTVLVWFRNDLRIQDNEMLSRISERGERIVPVYCFDPRHYTQSLFGTRKTGLKRAKFILESVQDLQNSFQLQQGNLIVKIGLPEEIIPSLATKYQVDEVYHHREVAQEETQLSSVVEDELWRLKINLRHFIGHTLYHKEDFPFPVKDIPDSFSVFRKKIERESFIRTCFDPPAQLSFHPDMEETTLPNLEDLGFDFEEIDQLTPTFFKGGEKEAQKQLLLTLSQDEKGLSLSPWLALGCLSVHTFYFSLVESSLPKKIKESSLQGLCWKDYFRFMFKKHGNLFFKEEGYTGNAPKVVEDQLLSFEDWKNANTADPEVNAIMKQLNETGYLPFASREFVAFYLINHLKVNWLWGAAYFEEKLIDYNPSSNYGNWAHLAGVGSSIDHNRSGNTFQEA